jgi:hypothetical protein
MSNPGDNKLVAGVVNIHRSDRLPLDDDTLVGAVKSYLLAMSARGTALATRSSTLDALRSFYEDRTIPWSQIAVIYRIEVGWPRLVNPVVVGRPPK